MASGSIPLSSNVSQATGRISWSSTSNQAGNYSLVNAEVFVILKGWGIQGTGSGEWYENGTLANTFRPKVNIAYGGTGNTSVYTKNAIKVAHDNSGNGSIKLGTEMDFSFAGINYLKGSGTCTMDKIDRYAEVKLADSSSYGINYINFSYTTDVTVDKAWYSVNGGSDVLIKEDDHTSGTFTINDLEPYTLYEVKVKVRRKDSQLSSESNIVAIRTLNKATITSAPNVTIGDNAVVSFSNPSGAAVEMAILNGDATKIVANYRAVTTSPYTFQFTQSELDAIYALIPGATSINLRYYIKTTQNGISYWHNVAKTFTVNQSINLPSAPTNITYADTNSKVLALTDNPSTILLGYSDVKVNIGTASTAKNQASIKSYSITDGTTTKEIDGTGSAPYSNTIEKVKRNSIDIFVFDSRNYSAKSSKALTTLDYQAPRINANTSLKRVGGVGTSVTFAFSGYIWNKSFGKVANSIKYFRYKMLPTTSSNWDSVSWINIDSSKYTLAADGTIANVADAILPDFTIGVAYNVKIELTDQLDQTATITLAINSGEPIVAYNKSKKIVGVGKIPDKTLPQGSIDAKGKIVAGGDITSGGSMNVAVGNDANPGIGYKAGGNVILRNGGTNTFLSSNGTMYFRPNGQASTEGQAKLYTNGVFDALGLYQSGRRIMGYNGGVSDFNSAVSHGIYYVGENADIPNAPYAEGAIYGTLEVTLADCSTHNWSYTWCWQKFRDVQGREFIRRAVNTGEFTAWQRVPNTLDLIYPIGSIVITGYDSATDSGKDPATLYGGTWELIDKEFKPWNGALTWTATNGTASVMASRAGHSVYVRADITTTAALSDSTVILGKITPESAGLKAFTYNKYESPFADGANSIAYMMIRDNGQIESVDINQAAGNRTIDSGAFFVVNFVDVPSLNNMLDSACDKFYWKRIS